MCVGKGRLLQSRGPTSASRALKCADTIGSVLVFWAGHFECQNINIFFQKNVYESNFIKQHSETVMV